jgi:hypothetical protein
MAEAWEDFGGPNEKAVTAKASPAKAPWEDFGAPGTSVDPLEGGQLPAATKGSDWSRRLKEAQGERPGLDTDNTGFLDNKYGPLDVAARAGEYLMAGTNTLLDGIDRDAIATGIADLPKKLGVDQQILPGSAVGALFEAFPAGGVETGMLPKAGVGKEPFRLAPEAEAQLSKMYETASADEITAFAKENGANLDQAQLKKYIDYRDANKAEKLKTDVVYDKTDVPDTPAQGELDLRQEPRQMDMDFSAPKTLEDTLAEEAADFRRSKPVEPTPDQVFPPKEEQLDLGLDEPAHQPSFDFDEPAYEKFGGEPQLPLEESKAVPPKDTSNPIQDKVNEVTADWKNAPKFEVVNSIDDIADPAIRKSVSESPNTRAFIGEDGVVRIIGKNVEPHEVTSIVYHEALGHNGLTNLFKEDLDKTLTNIVDTTPWFAQKVQKWIKKNPGRYADSPNRVARAADELFAEMSEDGRIKTTPGQKIYNKIANTIKDYGRKMGAKLEYSPREVRSILSDAHDTVVDGKGFRSYGENRFASEKKSLTPEKMETVGDIDDTLDFLGDKVSHLANGPVPIADTLREADDMGLNASKYLKSQSLSDKKLAARVAGAKQVLTDQVQELLRLKAKADKEGLTPTTLMDLQERIATAGLVFARFNNDTAELGRGLRLLREVTESRKLGKEMARFMDGEGLEGHMSSPEAVTEFLKKLEETSKNKPEQALKLLDGKEVKKAINTFYNVLNIPRTLMSTADLSAPFRQGIFMVGSKNFWKGIPEMLKQFYSEEHHDFIRDEIMNRPTYPLMQQAKLAITGGERLQSREEAFMSTFVEKIPVFGKLSRASERAYSGFLNKLRADTFDSLVKDYEKAGINLKLTNPKALHDIAKFTNAATGRGDMGGFTMGPSLNAMFFSPRLMASRVSLLNPKFYVDLDPIVRKQAIKSLISFGGIAATVAGMAKTAGAEVETDPRSSDFMKIKVGNTRYDIGGGFNQYIVLGTRIVTNEKKKTNGDVVELGKGFKSDDRVDMVTDFLTNKASPIPSYVIGYLKGKDPAGKPFDPTTEAAKRFIPLITQDIADVMADGSSPLAAAPSVFGVSTQTFDSGPKRKYDQYGSDIDKGTNDEVSEEVTSALGDKELSMAPKKVTIAGESIDLTGEIYDKFQKTSGEYFHTQMKDIVSLPGWKAASNEDKQKIIKDLVRESRSYAKEDLFGDTGEEEDK